MRAKRMKNMERTEGAEPSFNEIIDVSDDMRRRRGRRRKTVAMRVSAALSIVISICIGGFPAMLQYRSAHELSNTSDRSARAVAGWPYPQADDAIAAAKEYNKRLAASGQPILGEAKDRSPRRRAVRGPANPVPTNQTAPAPKIRNIKACWIPAAV